MPAHDAPGRIHFGVDLTYACNYSCPYCSLPPTLKHRTVDEWMRAWERVYRKYGSCYIYLSGGEPSIYPWFYDLIRAMVRLHTVDVCTNLSWKVERLIPELGPDRLKIAATFHPSQVPFEKFLPNAVHVREHLPRHKPNRGSVYFVADPKQMDRMMEYQARLEENGLALVPLPLVTPQKKMGNDEEQAKAIEAVSPNKNSPDHKLDYQLRHLDPKGRLCHAGQWYAHIRGDGKVDRCSRYEDRQLGNFFSDDFEMWPEPKACTQEYCPFESQWVVR